MGIETKLFRLDQSISIEEFSRIVNGINKDKNIHGILTFRPFQKHLDTEFINGFINKDKDNDCMNPINLEKIFEGKNVAVINRSMVVGKPLSMMHLAENATVTICHSKSKNSSDINSKADIVVTAVGRANMLDNSYFNEDSVVIDVSINDAVYGKISETLTFN